MNHTKVTSTWSLWELWITSKFENHLKMINFPIFNNTNWKFDNFPATHILREINFSNSMSFKTALLTFLEALNLKIFCISLEVWIWLKSKRRAWKTEKNGCFWHSQMPRIDFTQNLKSRKIARFSHWKIYLDFSFPLFFFQFLLSPCRIFFFSGEN